jgi:putative ABC transport system permease protein
MRPRWKKVIADLWDNKLRTILVVLSIAVGVFAVGMIAGAYVIISQDLGSSYAANNPANIKYHTDSFDDDLISSLKNLAGIKAVEGRREFNVRIRNNAGEWVSVDLLANPDYEASQINLLRAISGQMFPGDRQLVLEKKAMNELGLSVGDTVEIELPDGTYRQIPVVGVVQDPTTAAADFLANPLGYVTFDSLEWLRQPKLYNRLYLTVADQPNDDAYIRSVSNQAVDQLEKAGVTIARTQLSKTNEHPMTSTVQAVLGILGALGILVVFLSSSLIANTLAALVNAQQRFIGVMKLIGARSAQIFSMYMVLILFFGLIALLITVPLGAQAAYALSVFVGEKLNFAIQGYRVVPAAFMIQLVIALAVPMFAGLAPVVSGSRVSVQRAISGVDSNHTPKPKGWMDRSLERIKFLSRPYLISLRNTFRRKGRLILTLITLTMGGAIFIAMFNVQDSLHQYINQIGDYFLSDVTINFEQPYRLNEIEQTAMQIPGVQQVEGWAIVSGEALRPDGSIADSIQILAPPGGSTLVKPILEQGRWLQPGDDRAITLSETFLRKFPGLAVGDSIRLKLNGKEEDWEVVGIFRLTGAGGAAHIAYANYKPISEITNLPNRSFSFRILAGCNGNEQCQKEMTSKVDSYFRERGYHVAQTEGSAQTMKTASESLDILITFLMIMALLTAVVGSIGLTGTMGMNVLERTREIGVMRSIGAIDLQVIKSVIFEGMMIGLISYVLAVIVSFPITVLMSNIISRAIFETAMDLALNWQGFVIWFGLVMLLSALASVLPAHNASRLTIREVLAYE